MVLVAPNPGRHHRWSGTTCCLLKGATLEGIDLRTAFLFTLVGVVGYIVYHDPSLGTALVVALGFGLFADQFLRRR
ncbi:hypothetical protein B0E38_01421 [Streptomyces sp. 111WW2]|nr:hypothetical protein B0E38_01421 [Streptomyces sp. 111WW2]